MCSVEPKHLICCCKQWEMELFLHKPGIRKHFWWRNGHWRDCFVVKYFYEIISELWRVFPEFPHTYATYLNCMLQKHSTFLHWDIQVIYCCVCDPHRSESILGFPTVLTLSRSAPLCCWGLYCVVHLETFIACIFKNSAHRTFLTVLCLIRVSRAYYLACFVSYFCFLRHHIHCKNFAFLGGSDGHNPSTELCFMGHSSQYNYSCFISILCLNKTKHTQKKPHTLAPSHPKKNFSTESPKYNFEDIYIYM